MVEKKQQNVKNHRDLLNAEGFDETLALCLGACEFFGLQPAFLPPPSDRFATSLIPWTAPKYIFLNF